MLFFKNSGKSGIPEPEPELAGSIFLELISGNNFHYPNFELPELPDPKKSGNPNAQAYYDLTGYLVSIYIYTWIYFMQI